MFIKAKVLFCNTFSKNTSSVNIEREKKTLVHIHPSNVITEDLSDIPSLILVNELYIVQWRTIQVR